MKNSLVIFGAGYGFHMLNHAQWLNDAPIYYWGDIDTHGFVILNQLRQQFPNVMSLLMDEKTLITHKSYWGHEAQQQIAELALLTANERDVYYKLCRHTFKRNLRLEQELIAFDFLLATLKSL